jgi:hypothetical protein
MQCARRERGGRERERERRSGWEIEIDQFRLMCMQRSAAQPRARPAASYRQGAVLAKHRALALALDDLGDLADGGLAERAVVRVQRPRADALVVKAMGAAVEARVRVREQLVGANHTVLNG